MVRNRLKSTSNRSLTNRMENGVSQTSITCNLNLNLAMHRFFTFPLEFRRLCSFELLRMLSDRGLFYASDSKRDRLQCVFCKLVLEEVPNSEKALKVFAKNHRNCKIAKSRNVPMGSNVDGYLNLKFEAHRLYSLLKKLDWQHVEPTALARSGFYYTGDGDNVRCAFCSLEVRGWEAGDTPDGEHRRWNPNCPFVCNPGNAINVPIGSELAGQQETAPKINLGSSPFAVPELKKYGASIRLLVSSICFAVTPQDLNIRDWSAPLNPLFSSLSSRVESFKEFWPRLLAQKPLAMARAGFFYLGLADRVVCFHCNLGLKDWSATDDPFALHCRWNSSCQFLLLNKGPERLLQSNRNAQITMAKRGGMRCVKCEIKSLSKVNLPCGHMTFCTTCSGKSCVACGGEVVALVNLQGFSESDTRRMTSQKIKSYLKNITRAIARLYSCVRI